MAVALVGCTPVSHVVSVNGRTLLTHASTGASADALGFGVLGTNAAGCVTMGTSVLVVPDGSALASDGSITVLGKTYRVGTPVTFGGGGGDAPAGAKCGSHSVYFWAD
jgi:hypothetical protein